MEGYVQIYTDNAKGKTNATLELAIRAEEANFAVMSNLITEIKILALIDMKPKNVELFITGRGEAKNLIERADLVTEIKEIKHYYNQGVISRVGIEK